MLSFVGLSGALQPLRHHLEVMGYFAEEGHLHNGPRAATLASPPAPPSASDNGNGT